MQVRSVPLGTSSSRAGEDESKAVRCAVIGDRASLVNRTRGAAACLVFGRVRSGEEAVSKTTLVVVLFSSLSFLRAG